MNVSLQMALGHECSRSEGAVTPSCIGADLGFKIRFERGLGLIFQPLSTIPAPIAVRLR